MTVVQGLKLVMKVVSWVRLQDPVTFARKMRHLHLLESRLLGHSRFGEFPRIKSGRPMFTYSEQSKHFDI